MTDEPLVTGLAHVCFVVSDPARSEAFYRALGFERRTLAFKWRKG
ncbi:MAG: VOC family protein [Anaerolineae bacterium]